MGKDIVGKMIVRVSLTLLLVFWGVQISAADPGKMGVVNVQKVIALSSAGKAAKTRLDEKLKGLRSSLKENEDRAKGLQQEIEKKSSVWSEEKKAEKIREFQKIKRELKAKSEDASFEVKQFQDKELEPILKTLDGIITQYGKDNGYALLSDSRAGFLYVDEAVDVTDEIIKLLDKAMAK